MFLYVRRRKCTMTTAVSMGNPHSVIFVGTADSPAVGTVTKTRSDM